MNAVTMSLLKNICGVEISFGQWSLVGVPVALVSIVLAWLILCWLCKPEIDIVKGLDSLKEDRKNVGPLKGDELKFTIVFAIMVVLWFIPKRPVLIMYMTAWGGIFIMSLPGMNLVNWKEASTKIDWSAFDLRRCHCACNRCCKSRHRLPGSAASSRTFSCPRSLVWALSCCSL